MAYIYGASDQVNHSKHTGSNKPVKLKVDKTTDI